jgi:hypothetical protein
MRKRKQTGAFCAELDSPEDEVIAAVTRIDGRMKQVPLKFYKQPRKYRAFVQHNPRGLFPQPASVVRHTE